MHIHRCAERTLKTMVIDKFMHYYLKFWVLLENYGLNQGLLPNGIDK